MQPPFPFVHNAPVLSVSQLTAEIQDLLETTFPSVWVAGEVSNLSRPQSGHVYFTLKDDSAQLKAVLWKSAAARLAFELRDGLEVLCQGRLDVYPPRGTYQIDVQEIHPSLPGLKRRLSVSSTSSDGWKKANWDLPKPWRNMNKACRCSSNATPCWSGPNVQRYLGRTVRVSGKLDMTPVKTPRMAARELADVAGVSRLP